MTEGQAVEKPRSKRIYVLWGVALALLVASVAPAAAGEPPKVGKLSAKETARLATLVKQLGHDEWEMREKASAALRKIGGPALAELKKALKSKDMEVQTRAESLVSKIERDVSFSKLGNTLIAEFSAKRVLEVDKYGKEVWTLSLRGSPICAQRLPDGSTFVAMHQGKVAIYDRDGKAVWELAGGRDCLFAAVLKNGNVLVSNSTPGTVTEYDRKKKVVWQVKGFKGASTCQRLASGNTLISQSSAKRVVEVDRKGKVVWKLEKQGLIYCAQRLPGGNTLVCSHSPPEVREVDPKGKVVWKCPTKLVGPISAVRLMNGHTLITTYSGNRVLEVDRKGKLVWEKKGLKSPWMAVRLEKPTKPAAAVPKKMKVAPEKGK